MSEPNRAEHLRLFAQRMTTKYGGITEQDKQRNRQRNKAARKARKKNRA